MARIVVVDDSASILAILVPKLEALGHQVEPQQDAYVGAERILKDPPDLVVTDLWMPGMSGLQLCRLLRAEPETANVPVVLLTGADDKRSRFWAHRSGAAAFVTKHGATELLTVVQRLLAEGASPDRPTPPSLHRPGGRGSVHSRLAHLLDAALYDSVLAGEVRALASAGSYDKVAAGLTRLLAQLVELRYVALEPVGGPRIVVGRPELGEALCSEVDAALGPSVRGTTFVGESVASTGAAASPPTAFDISFGGDPQGRLLVCPATVRFVAEDEGALSLAARELGGPLRMAALMTDANRLAATDTLTGLLNRRAFADVVARDLSLAERHGWPVSLLLLDLDHFKAINDVHGHVAGDQVLVAVARALSSTVRKSDLVARWGGEEFVVALSHAATSGARVMAERLRRQIAERAVPLASGGSLAVTASIGVATLGKGEDLDALFARADRAMYAAKAKGRNRVESL